jgi:integrase
MKVDRNNGPAQPATLQDVIDRVVDNAALSDSRKRDLRSGIVVYAKVIGEPPAAIPMDLASIRKTLDGVVPLQAKVSRKRWANLRSDIAGAIAASGLQPMLKTFGVELDKDWPGLLDAANDKAVANGLSRLTRWASLRHVSSEKIDSAALGQFFAELESGSLVRNLRFQRRNVAKLWNRLVALLPDRGLQTVQIPSSTVTSNRLPWQLLPASLRKENDDYLSWCSVPDPLDEDARARALASATLRLHRDHIHLAASAACSAGINANRLTSLSRLVEPEMFRTIMRQQWKERGQKPTSYIVSLASVLIKIASEWVKVPPEQLAALKEIRSKLGRTRSGLTEKNKAVLRRFDDPRLLGKLINLPDVLWRAARRNMPLSKGWWFIDLQTALAIDILLHIPLRIENLHALKFDQHLHWPQGKGKPALMVIRYDETKNEEPLEFELPSVLSERLYTFRNEIAAAVIGRRPDFLFVSKSGKRRTLRTLGVAIERTVIRRVGVKITPHQFRHLGAKLALDANPGAYELVRQLLGHRSLKTTTRFYAGPDTRRAGRAHADLIRKLREPNLERSRRRRDEDRE